MNNFSETNKKLLVDLIMANPQLNELNMEGNTLIYNNETVDLSNFNLVDLINSETYLGGQIENLSSEDVFRIIRLHALTLTSEQPQVEQNNKFNTSNENQLQVIKEVNPLLKNVTISYKKNEYGGNDEYINIVDSNGKDHLLYNYANSDIIQIYKDLINKTGNLNITPEELYTECLRKLKEVSLRDTHDILNDGKTSEEFSTKVEQFEKSHRQDKHYSLGNEEHDILISNDHTVSSFSTNEYGDMVQQNHKSGNVSEENENYTVQTEQNEEIVNNSEQDEEVKVQLISEEEFYHLINSEMSLSQKEQEQVDLFNSYLGELMIYRDYLLPKLRDILARFENTIMNFELAEEETLNQNQQRELAKYYELRQKKDEIELENREKTKEEVMRLEYKLPENYNSGHVNYIAIIVAILIVAGALSLVVFTLMKY